MSSEWKRRRYLPDIVGLKDLFMRQRWADKRATIESDESGFPHGSTLLLAGSSGSGKTILALAMVRQLLRDVELRKECGETRLYYVSTLGDRRNRERRFGRFGWFTNDDLVFTEDRVEIIDVSEMSLPQPTRGANELINPVFTKIRQVLRRERGETAFVIVDSLTALLKDSTGDGDRRRNVGEVLQRLTDVFGAERLGLVFFVAEWPESQPRGATPEEAVADVVLHLRNGEIGLGRRRRILEVRKSQGASLRWGQHSWAVVSSQTIRRVIVNASMRGLVRAKLEDDKRWGPDRRRGRWCTAAIFARPALIPLAHLQGWSTLPTGVDGQQNEPGAQVKNGIDSPAARLSSGADYVSIGTPGLDEMLHCDGSFWGRPSLEDWFSKQPLQSGGNGLLRASTTLVIGKSGTGKTIASLQFLLANPEPSRSLYINCENRPLRIRDVFPASKQQLDALKGCHAIYRRHADLNFHALLSEIIHMIMYHDIDRIAFDGLADLFATHDRHECSMLLEELLVVIRQTGFGLTHREDDPRVLNALERLNPRVRTPPKPAGVTLLLTLETDTELDRHPTLGALSFAADNLIVFQHVTINDEIRNTVRIVKARGQAPDRQIREAIVSANRDFPLRVVAGLENYHGLLSGHPQPVQVTLQLLAENGPERRFNRKLCRNLRNLFAYPVKMIGFSRDEIRRTLADVASGLTRIPQANVKIISIDEWWVGELRASAEVTVGRRPTGNPHPLLPLDPFLLADKPGFTTDPETWEAFSSDYWITEFEKACSLKLVERAGATARTRSGATDGAPPASSTGTAPVHSAVRTEICAEMVACPGYLDFGLLCLNAEVATKLGWNVASDAFAWPHWLAAIPRTWARTDDAQNWFQSPHPERMETVVDFLTHYVRKASPEGSCCGFAFDMATPSTIACVFLEFCWTFGATEEFLIADTLEYFSRADSGARAAFVADNSITRAIEFLQFLVVEGLLGPRSSLTDTRKALLSRHWYSTLCDVDPPAVGAAGSAGNRTQAKGVLWALPFFPVGAFSTQEFQRPISRALLHALRDAVMRFERVLVRIRAAAEYRLEILRAEGREWFCDYLSQLAAEASDFHETASEWAVARPSDAPKDEDVVERQLKWISEASEAIRNCVSESRAFLAGQGWRRRQNPDGESWHPVPIESLAVAPTPAAPQYWRELPAAMALDARDVFQLLEWSDFRVELIRRELKGRSLASLYTSEQVLPSAEERSDLPVALTGYSCVGSWMMGVDRSTHSPQLACKFIEEIGSLENAQLRAEIGAGIPVRKDFYDLFGESPVPAFQDRPFSWKELLKVTVSRSHRRDRAVCSDVPMASILDLLVRELLHCLSVAAQCSHRYRDEIRGDGVRFKQIEVMKRTAQAAVVAIFESVHRQMQDKHRGKEPCLLCVRPEKCRSTM